MTEKKDEDHEFELWVIDNFPINKMLEDEDMNTQPFTFYDMLKAYNRGLKKGGKENLKDMLSMEGTIVHERMEYGKLEEEWNSKVAKAKDKIERYLACMFGVKIGDTEMIEYRELRKDIMQELDCIFSSKQGYEPPKCGSDKGNEPVKSLENAKGCLENIRNVVKEIEKEKIEEMKEGDCKNQNYAFKAGLEISLQIIKEAFPGVAEE